MLDDDEEDDEENINQINEVIDFIFYYENSLRGNNNQ